MSKREFEVRASSKTYVIDDLRVVGACSGSLRTTAQAPQTLVPVLLESAVKQSESAVGWAEAESAGGRSAPAGPPIIDFNKLDKIFPKARFALYSGCAEPGYYDDKLVILADWNDVSNRMFTRLEQLGYSCEWSDEWVACGTCDKVFRTKSDSYGGEMAGVLRDGDAICLECLDAGDHYQSIENNYDRAVTSPIAERYPPEQYGYELVQDGYEAGLHPGQTDDPVAILGRLCQREPLGRFLFVLTGQGQFDVSFAVYRKASGLEEG